MENPASFSHDFLADALQGFESLTQTSIILYYGHVLLLLQNV